MGKGTLPWGGGGVETSIKSRSIAGLNLSVSYFKTGVWDSFLSPLESECGLFPFPFLFLGYIIMGE